MKNYFQKGNSSRNSKILNERKNSKIIFERKDSKKLNKNVVSLLSSYFESNLKTTDSQASSKKNSSLTDLGKAIFKTVSIMKEAEEEINVNHKHSKFEHINNKIFDSTLSNPFFMILKIFQIGIIALIYLYINLFFKDIFLKTLI